MSFILPLLAAAAVPTGLTQPLIIDQGRADRVQVPPPLPEQQPPKPTEHDAELSRVDATGSDRPITGVRFLGDKVPAPVAEAAKVYLGKPATRRTLQQLAVALSKAYEQSNVALYTVAIPDQDLSNGRVDVRIAEGFVEDIVYPKGASRLMRAYAERLRALKPLSRSALERELSLMRDIAGAKVTANLLRGRKAGGVILSLAIERKHSDFAFSYNNRGTAALGEGQFKAEASGYSLLRDGDETKLLLLSASDLKRYIYGSLSHSTPIGSDGLRLSMSAAYLETRPNNLPLPVRGKAKTAGLSLSYPVLRGYKRNLTVSAGLDAVNSDAALFGLLLSSDRVRTARAAAGYSQVDKKSVLSLGSTVSKGLGILNARGFAGYSDPEFTKVNASASYNRAIGKRLVARLAAEGQYSKDLLPATELLAIGGPQFGRAFDDAAVTADRGVAGSFELAVRPELGKLLKGTELYGYADYATVHINQRFGVAADYDLGSAGGGVRFAVADKGYLGVEGAKVIKDPFNGALGDWRVNLSWRLSLGKK